MMKFLLELMDETSTALIACSIILFCVNAFHYMTDTARQPPPNPLEGVVLAHHEWSWEMCGGRDQVVWLGFNLYGDLGASCSDGTDVWLFNGKRWIVDKPTRAEGLKKVTVYGEER